MASTDALSGFALRAGGPGLTWHGADDARDPRAYPPTMYPTVVERVAERRDVTEEYGFLAEHARVLQPGDPLVGEQRAVGAHHDRRTPPGAVRREPIQVFPQQRLAAREDDQRRGVHLEDLVQDADAVGGGQLPRRRLVRPG